jgi:hypothetical protein
MTLVSQPQRLPRSPALNLRSGILLVALEFIVGVASGFCKLRSSLDRITIDLSGLGVFGLDVVLDEKTVLFIEFHETARESLGCAEIGRRLAHVLQPTEDLETIAAIAIADLEPSRVLVELLTIAAPVHFLFLLHSAGDDLVVIDLFAELFDVVRVGLGSIADAELGHIAARPSSFDRFRPFWESVTWDGVSFFDVVAAVEKMSW